MISQIKSKKERNVPAKRAKFFTLEYLFLREDNAPIELCIIEIRCSGEGAGSGWTLEGEEEASGAMIVAASIYFYVHTYLFLRVPPWQGVVSSLPALCPLGVRSKKMRRNNAVLL